MCHFHPPFLTLCSINSIWSRCSRWSKLACWLFSWYTSCRWGEWGNITRCKEWCWNGSQLNCSHMMSKSESRLKSSILILRFPDSICWGLSVWICHPWGIWECLEWVYRVCLWLYLNTHTQMFLSNTQDHATWQESHSQDSHCWHTWYTDYRKVTYKKPTRRPY